jgi:outer membrane protein
MAYPVRDPLSRYSSEEKKHGRGGMRKTGFFLLAAAVLLSAGFSAYGQSNAFKDILNVAVVDISRIFEVFFEESRAVRELQQFRDRVRTEIQLLEDEIEVLRSAKIDAELDDRASEALRLEEEILGKEQFLQDLRQVRFRELENRRAALVDDDFLVEISQAVEFVAVRDGFSLVLERNTILPVYMAEEVDITEEVLSHLFSTVGKKYP